MSDAQPSLGEQLALIHFKLDLLITQRDDHEARIRHLESFAEKPEDRRERDAKLDRVTKFMWLTMGLAAGSPGVWWAALSRVG